MTPTLRILYGPPGTGKTWRAARDAVKLLDPAVADSDVVNRHQEFVQSGRIVWVTFHPSYTYEDFVEGLRPLVTDVGVTYVPKPGPFRQACRTALTPPTSHAFQVGKVLASSTGQEYEVVHYDAGTVILQNLKGKGVGLLTPVSLWLVDRLISLGLKSGDLSIPGTAHDRKQELSHKVGVDMQSLFSMTGPLRAVWEAVEARPAQAGRRSPIVVVIDEINRADTARVFGELVTLLEPDKRLGAAEERKVVLPYSHEAFGIPADVHVIGTMNTADRSLTLIDHALRRRFQFVEVAPEPARCADPWGGISLGDLLSAWNERVAAVLSRDHRIGHAYLMRGRLESVRQGRGYSNDDEGQLRALARVVRTNILPLLAEYFHDDWRMIDFIFGKNWSSNQWGLLETQSLSKYADAAGELIDLEEASDYAVPAFWDPDSDDWDAAKFRARLLTQ